MHAFDITWSYEMLINGDCGVVLYKQTLEKTLIKLSKFEVIKSKNVWKNIYEIVYWIT